MLVHDFGCCCVSVISGTTAPIKPSKQTQILLDSMSKRSDDEDSRWDQVMTNFDLLFNQVTEINTVQRQMKTQMDIRAAAMDQYSQEQHLIAQQVKANGQAVAQLTLRQFESEAKYDTMAKDDNEDNASLLFDDHESFHNIFGKDRTIPKTEHPKSSKFPFKHDKKDTMPKHSMPKMNFPVFDGSAPKVWIDNCHSYFELYQLPEGMWITAATLHLKDNAAKWWQAYKQNHTFKTWKHFCQTVEEQFGADDFRSAVTDLLELRQQGSLEEYTTQF